MVALNREKVRFSNFVCKKGFIGDVLERKAGLGELLKLQHYAVMHLLYGFRVSISICGRP